MNKKVVWDLMLCSLVNRRQCFRGMDRLRLQIVRISLKMKEAGLSAKLLPVHKTTRCHITVDSYFKTAVKTSYLALLR
jgi:hypothetical protein